MPKHIHRLRILDARKSLPVETCRALSHAVQQRFLGSDVFRKAGCLALYSPIHNEVDTAEVARQAIIDGKLLVYPRVQGAVLEFIVVHHLDELVPGYMGVLEPTGREVVSTTVVDVLVVPGVAFDLAGYRLGYGQGYYDRALAACRRNCLKVGFAYEQQLVATLPTEGHDESLSALMTENRIIEFTAGPPISRGGLDEQRQS